ncbi:Glycosyl transferase family 2 [Xylanibacter ruminicola]|uniref:Glycosyl transferase family 2 n=2 Tax=Xylanibacter ruminicola TaxID=839 RepID=A0A1M7JIV6_XYLRU|nr:Glycosyl transferase family 2 [Xylanibacter ruminicola]
MAIMKVYTKEKEKKWWHGLRFAKDYLLNELETRKLMKTELSEPGVTSKKRKVQVVVSLTSYPKRIGTIHQDIKTLLNQTFKPDHVILSLAIEQFPGKEKDLPLELLLLRDFGLEIKWTEDIRSYKKLVPIYEEYKQHIIVTADDDLYYSRDWLEKLYKGYQKDPYNIQCNVVNAFFIDENKDIYQLRDQRVYHKEASYLNSLVGFGGVLYPPMCLYEDITEKELFMNLAPTNDDLWFWAMGILKGTRVRVIEKNNLIGKTIKETVGEGLTYLNNGDNSPFLQQLGNILNHYPKIQEKLLSESI